MKDRYANGKKWTRACTYILQVCSVLFIIIFTVSHIVYWRHPELRRRDRIVVVAFVVFVHFNFLLLHFIRSIRSLCNAVDSSSFCSIWLYSCQCARRSCLLFRCCFPAFFFVCVSLLILAEFCQASRICVIWFVDAIIHCHVSTSMNCMRNDTHITTTMYLTKYWIH